MILRPLVNWTFLFDRAENRNAELSKIAFAWHQARTTDSYDHVFGDGNGNFIMTNDAFYDPSSDLNVTGNWTSLEPSR